MRALAHLVPILVMSLQILASPCKPGPATGKAVYILTNEQVNTVLALPIASDGTINGGAPCRSIATSGSGSNGVLATGQLAGPDALFSQSALTIAGKVSPLNYDLPCSVVGIFANGRSLQFLFAVNSGSNTVSMFAIDERDPTQLTLVGQPALIPGDFPTTVAASNGVDQVCVGCTGAKAGVSCASFTAQGLGAMDSLRPFELGQTTPPVGPTNTVSQVFFSNDDTMLFSTVKGDPASNKTGFLAAFPINGKNVSQDSVRTSPNGTAVLFGSSTIPGSNSIFVTDASFGAAVLSIDRTGIAAVQGKGTINGQKATCWSTFSSATNTAFVTDVATNRLVEMSTSDASVISQIDLNANGDPGLIDLKAAGRFIYALSPGNDTTQAAVTVVDAISKHQVQHIQFEQASLSKNAQGIAVLI
ncbi:hypothetical protein SCUP515_12187 [Seiridium cupressi]